MTTAAVNLLARSRRLRRAHIRCLPLRCTEAWSSRSASFKVNGENAVFSCDINGNHQRIRSEIFSLHSKGLHATARGIHTKQYELGKHYESQANSYAFKFYDFRPLLVVYRATYIMAEVTMLSVWHFLLKDIQKRAEKLRRCLIRLGPFYIKLGQALSTRPDILPSAYCQELAKLQDQIPPFRSSIALKFIESELGFPAKKLFAEISAEPVAAASLGQVYKARLFSGELVAVKVQRPGMQARLTLDSYLLHIVGGPLQRFLGARGDIVAAVSSEMVEHMFDEIDYVKEGCNAERFAILYGGLAREYEGFIKSADHISCSSRQRRRANTRPKYGETSDLVKVPKIYWNLSSKGVLTMEWIDGIKLTDLETLHKLNFDVQHLVDQGVFSSLRQLLEEGFFHADPHPGNLVVTKEGMLAYFDFGMMGDFPKVYRIGLIRTLVHFVNRDSLGLANDFSGLGFVPKEANLEDIAHALRASFGDESSKAQLDFQVIAIAEQSSTPAPSKQQKKGRTQTAQDGLGKGTARTWGSFDTRTVVSATSDLFEFILSEEGYRVRVLLVQDIVKSFHAFLDEVIRSCIYPRDSANDDKSPKFKAWGQVTNQCKDGMPNEGLDGHEDTNRITTAGDHQFKGVRQNLCTGESSDEQIQTSQGSSEEIGSFGSRVSVAISAFVRAVNSAPELWILLLCRFAVRPEAQALVGNIIFSLVHCCCYRGSESIWLMLSRMLHEIYDGKF